MDDDTLDDLKVKRNIVTGLPEVYCFPQLIDQFLQVNVRDWDE